MEGETFLRGDRHFERHSKKISYGENRVAGANKARPRGRGKPQHAPGEFLILARDAAVKNPKSAVQTIMAVRVEVGDSGKR